MLKGLAPSREKAKALIMAGLVAVEGRAAAKAGVLVAPDADLHVRRGLAYVSRGGEKLAAALAHFALDVRGRVLLDVGASTGGFTDCLLQGGAAQVIAVDVGYGQLDWKLRQDPRVRLLERTNIRFLTAEQIGAPAEAAVIDVSFISLRLVLPAVGRLLSAEAFVVALIKPQFEVGRSQVGKGGVVRDPRLHAEVVAQIQQLFREEGWRVEGVIPSPLLGPKGNREFLLYAVRGALAVPAGLGETGEGGISGDRRGG